MIMDQSLLNKSLTHLSVALVHLCKSHKPYTVHKDLNGGFGTADDFSGFRGSALVRFFKKQTVSLPVIGFAHLQSIFKNRGAKVTYIEGDVNDISSQFDIVLLYGSIVDHVYENEQCQLIKHKFPEACVGFFGNFVQTSPHLFAAADFILFGEAESYFAEEFTSLDQLKGCIKVKSMADYDALPVPDLTGFPIDDYQYSLSQGTKRFVPYQSSKGCPYSCSFYCTYGKFQGPKIRQRSAEKVVSDLLYLKNQYNVECVQFRDPVFGLKRGFIDELCEQMHKIKLNIVWGMETRADLLNEKNLKQMFAVGLRRINIGIETTDVQVAQRNKRPLILENHQEHIVNLCQKIGITVAAFYVFGLEGDSKASIKQTINYAIKLNTPVARFAVATPYPGTGFYEKLRLEGKLLTNDLEKYTQFNLVFKHANLTPADIRRLLGKAYCRYYLRLDYWGMMISKFIKRHFKGSNKPTWMPRAASSSLKGSILNP